MTRKLTPLIAILALGGLIVAVAILAAVALPVEATDPSMDCGWGVSTAHVDGEHGEALICPAGTLRNFTDVEGGVYVPGDPAKLNLNLSGGDAVHRGYVVLSPDNGKGTIMEDGHLHKLLLVRGRRYGGTEFRTRVRFERGMVVCDRSGCVDVLKALRQKR